MGERKNTAKGSQHGIRWACAVLMTIALTVTSFQFGHIDQAQAAAATTNKKVVYLTFDDGPSVNTPQVLDILAKEKVKATFFVIGKQAEKFPSTLKRVVAEGHQVGNHSYNHVYKELYTDYSQYWAQMAKTQRIIQQITGKLPSVIRTPGGTYMNYDASYFQYIQAAGFNVMDWNAECGDAIRANVPAAELVAHTKKSKMQNTMVLLMHDGPGHKETVKALPEIIQFFKQKGYQFDVITGDTKPVQFPLAAKTQWPKKAMTKEAALEMMKKDMDVWPSEKAKALQNQTLNIQKGTTQWHLQANQFMMLNNRYFVGLRALAEQMSGSVGWDSVQNLVTLQVGDITAKIDADKKLITYKRLEQQFVSVPFDVQKQQNTIIVNLRDFLSLFPYQTVGMTKDDSGATLTIE